MPLGKGLDRLRQQLPGCVAVGFVDMAAALLLAARTVGSHPPEVLEMVAAATSDLFKGPRIQGIEEVFKRVRGLPGDSLPFFREYVAMSPNLLHVFVRSTSNTTHVLVAVFPRSVEPKLLEILATARTGLAELEKLV